MIEGTVLKVGDVVQVRRDFENQAFAGCMVIVTDPKAFGCQGYVQCLGEDRASVGGQAFIRLDWKDMEFVGQVAWFPE